MNTTSKSPQISKISVSDELYQNIKWMQLENSSAVLTGIFRLGNEFIDSAGNSVVLNVTTKLIHGCFSFQGSLLRGTLKLCYIHYLCVVIKNSFSPLCVLHFCLFCFKIDVILIKCNVILSSFYINYLKT